MKRRRISDAVWPSDFEPKVTQKTRELTIDIITPVFGGDVESWKLNEKKPIRSQAIKGQLRFWWRTMQTEQDHKVLLAHESALWGGTSKNNDQEIRLKSRVEIAVVEQKIEQIPKVMTKERNGKFSGLGNNAISNYVLFPIIEKVKTNEKILILEKGTFKLIVNYPHENEQEVLNTLKLWVLFGGVGARTRRGCGSIYCRDLLAEFKTHQDVIAFVKNLSQAKGVSAGTSKYPILAGGKLFGTEETKGVDVKSLQDAYGVFRQDRAPGNQKPGRSYWPEPDAIRKVLEQHAPLHEPKHPDGVWFPRAAFGLPILTQFNTRDNGAGDPFDKQIELSPQGKDRWPSPVFIKVTKLSDNCWLKLVLVLNHKTPELSLQKKHLESSAKPDNLKGKVMIKDPENPKKSLNGRTIYQALADHLKLGVWINE